MLLVSELTLLLIRFAYLAVLWIFVLSAVSVIRSDMFGARAARQEAADKRPTRQQRRKSSKPRRGSPSSVTIVEGANVTGRGLSRAGQVAGFGIRTAWDTSFDATVDATDATVGFFKRLADF